MSRLPADSAPRRVRATRVLSGAVLVAGVLVVLLFPLPDHDSRAAGAGGRPAPVRSAIVTVPAQTSGQPIPRSFLGLSTEYWTLPIYARHLALFERVLSLLRVPGDGAFVLRIGGDSADHAAWLPRAEDPAPWVFRLTPSWVSAARGLVRAMRLRVILDLNLLTGSPRAAARWAAVAGRAFPPGSIAAYEIGNEPDIYERSAWLAELAHAALAARVLPADLTARRYVHDFHAYVGALARAVPRTPVAGPALANPGVDLSWIAALLQAPHPGLGLVTAHRYAFAGCAPPWTRRYPTIARVLGPRATIGVARSIEPAVRLAHRAGLPFRMTELNSVNCGGRRGVSNSFATALWAPDALLELVRAGVNGVNLHAREYAINAPFSLGSGGLTARPLLYGLILFVRTVAPGARLLRVHVHAPTAVGLHAWAVRLRDGVLHVLLIDKGRQTAGVVLRAAGGAASVQRLLAPSPAATTGVTLAGQALSPAGTWTGRRIAERVARSFRSYHLLVPAGTAALVTIRPSRGNARGKHSPRRT
jgi:hypothetical protein